MPKHVFNRLLFIFSAAVILWMSGVFSAPASSIQPPNFWDKHQRLAKADLSSLSRVRFLTTTDYFPFNTLDRTGNLVGFHIDLAREICDELEIQDRCQIQALPLKELDQALKNQDGEALIAGIELTDDTRKHYLFSKPYMQFPGRFLSLKTDIISEPIYHSLKNKSVGVLAGTSHETALRELFNNVDIVSFPNTQELLTALQTGKVLAIFGDGLHFSFDFFDQDSANCCAFSGGAYYLPDYFGHGLAIAVRKDLPELAKSFDYALQRLEANGKMAELYLRYFPIAFY